MFSDIYHLTFFYLINSYFFIDEVSPIVLRVFYNINILRIVFNNNSSVFELNC